ncbi:hypothetical protein GCM10007907_20730 [Chitinimonas prasina]|uniref:Uncharacterized protein n=1 Tax=Chitinimonas prasina TaxID=1434937 RepID=A0ABQ5YHX5_9NEIS|nr:hypothetical protein GCM10007907_20730 [Chitinimonas prasina]
MDQTGQYQGKPSLNDSSSFQLKEACEHWRREIIQAVESGKTVFVYLPEVQEVYIDTGKRNYSGTGHNRATTRIVERYTNYAALPNDLKPVNATGSAMKLAPLGADILAPYWAEFGSVSEYKVRLTAESICPSILTKNGDMAVATIQRSKMSSGALVLLPDIDFYPETFIGRKGEPWTPAAKRFAAKLISCVVALDKALHSTAEVTPEPDWASDPSFVLEPERVLRSELLDVERKVEEAQRRLEETQASLRDAGQLRALLYEKGKPLEHAIVGALSRLGFSAAPYKDAQSEFDVVFQSTEGRLLGEAEGKDSKAINVDKLRQLSMNIHEDLQREEVTKPAKGVLFGNGFRLSSPNNRGPQFTEKCISAAVSSSTALVPTSELFRAIQYLAAQPDDGYASECRAAIINGVGVVELPATPYFEAQEAEAAER